MTVGVLSGDDIVDLLGAVADRLEESLGAEPATIVVVGGSFMALHGLRAGIADVVLGPHANFVFLMRTHSSIVMPTSSTAPSVTRIP